MSLGARSQSAKISVGCHDDSVVLGRIGEDRVITCASAYGVVDVLSRILVICKVAAELR